MKFLPGSRLWSATYNNYVAAMSRRRPESCLDSCSFYNYIDRDDVSAYVDADASKKVTAVIGQTGAVCLDDEQFFVFKVSHFAPASNRSGVEILKKMAKVKDKIIIFTVTSDLCEMLQGCGFIACNIVFDVLWDGQTQQKHVFTQKNNDLIVRSLLKNKTF